jgi:hypothetical protein
MDVCKRLRINDTIFDGFLLPETIDDALIFFSTEITYNAQYNYNGYFISLAVFCQVQFSSQNFSENKVSLIYRHWKYRHWNSLCICISYEIYKNIV